MGKDIALVYMVAGLSSRFNGKIKSFAELGPKGESLIEYSLKQALPAGFNKLVFIVGEATEQAFKGKFGDSYSGIPVEYALQKFDSALRDKPWGTADALCSARDLIDSDFVVCNGDDLYGASAFRILIDHLALGEEVTIGYSLADGLPASGEANRGIFTVDSGKVKGINEVIGISKSNLEAKGLKLEDLCSMNIFGLKRGTLGLLCDRLDVFKEKNNGDRKIECYLPNQISKLIDDGELNLNIYPAKERWIGITYPADVEEVRKVLSE